MTTALPRHRWLWLLAGAIMALELLVFHQLAAKRQAMVYPRWSDQIQYLSESYYSYDELKAHGWRAGLTYACTNPAAQGTLHDIVAVVAFVALKGLGVYGAARAFGAPHVEALERAAIMAHGGEFAFVLYGAALAVGLIDPRGLASLAAIIIP